mmetsp:Transcript_20317/g.81165  ORF Transcript_20317/g.81165 Transcript_20317/m.81165 type:complete len:287 (-) Transcript_20317:220-1080(-)
MSLNSTTSYCCRATSDAASSVVEAMNPRAASATKRSQACPETAKAPIGVRVVIKPMTRPSTSKRGPPDMPPETAASAMTTSSTTDATMPDVAAKAARFPAPGTMPPGYPSAIATSPMLYAVSSDAVAKRNSGNIIADVFLTAATETSTRARSNVVLRAMTVPGMVVPSSRTTSRLKPGSATCAAVRSRSESGVCATTNAVPPVVMLRMPLGRSAASDGFVSSTSLRTRVVGCTSAAAAAVGGARTAAGGRLSSRELAASKRSPAVRLSAVTKVTTKIIVVGRSGSS